MAGIVAREQLTDDTVLVFISDTHIGGTRGSDIFASAGELTAFFTELAEHDGPLELVLAGDFLDLLRIGSTSVDDLVDAMLTGGDYEELFAALRRVREAPDHRVVYMAGNHDAEAWWNPRLQQSLITAGVVDEFALSYVASYASLPHHLVYCEHGNQFDPTNRILDYADPLDTPIGSHIVTDVIRPIGAGMTVTRTLDLHDLSYVFPLAKLPEWVAGRLYYRLLRMVIHWFLVPLIIAYGIYHTTAAILQPTRTAVEALLLEVADDAVVLLAACIIFFVVSRTVAQRVIASLAHRFRGRGLGDTHEHGNAAIQRLLESGASPPMADRIAGRDIAVFVSGHTHAPAAQEMGRADGGSTVIVNTGCWLRQLQPVTAWLKAPPVFVPAFVQTHVHVTRTGDGLTVELWERPKRADRRLPSIERLAVLGRMPDQPSAVSEPRLVAVHSTGPGASRSAGR